MIYVVHILSIHALKFLCRIDNFSDRWIPIVGFSGIDSIDPIVLAGRESLTVARRG